MNRTLRAPTSPVRRRSGALSVCCTVLLALAGPGAMAADAAPPARSIAIDKFMFGPAAVTVVAGTAVTWRNLDGEPHTVVSVEGLFRSGALDQNDAFTYTFTRPGTYRYVCSIHPQMVGTIVVTAAP